MRRAKLAMAATLAFASWGCGATTTGGADIGPASTVTTASATFMTRDDGKDDDSAIAVQIMDENDRLSAEGTVVDIEFGDRTVSAPLALTMTRPCRHATSTMRACGCASRRMAAIPGRSTCG